jgi:hypothetical protein
LAMFEEFTSGGIEHQGMSNWDNAWQSPAKPIGSAGDLMVLAVGIW